MKKINLILVSVLLTVCSVYAQNDTSVSGIIKSPSLMALGNSTVGGYNQDASLEINPAGLSRLDYSGITVGYRSWLAGMTVVDGSVYVDIPVNSLSMGIGAGFDYIGIKSANLQSYDAAGVSSGVLSAGSTTVHLGVGLGLPVGFSVGLSYDFIHQKRDLSDGVIGSTISLGAIYTLVLGDNYLDFGANIKNTFSDGYNGDYMVGLVFRSVSGLNAMLSVSPSSDKTFYFDTGFSYSAHMKNGWMVSPKLSYRQGVHDADGGGINFGADLIAGNVKLGLGFSYAQNMNEFNTAGAISYFLKENKKFSQGGSSKGKVKSEGKKSKEKDAELARLLEAKKNAVGKDDYVAAAKYKKQIDARRVAIEKEKAERVRFAERDAKLKELMKTDKKLLELMTQKKKFLELEEYQKLGDVKKAIENRVAVLKARLDKVIANASKINQLNLELQKALQTENYDAASLLKKKIKELSE